MNEENEEIRTSGGALGTYWKGEVKRNQVERRGEEAGRERERERGPYRSTKESAGEKGIQGHQRSEGRNVDGRGREGDM